MLKKILTLLTLIIAMGIGSPILADSTDTATKIEIDINHHKLHATLNNSTAAKDFKRRLPITLRFRKYPGLPEKVADLNSSLSTKGMPKGCQGKKGYIGYWSPDQRIVFYYGNEEYYEGIHLIGKFTSPKYSSVIKQAPQNAKVTIVESK